MEPLLIKVDPSDNVSIVANSGGLPAGTVCEGLVFLDAVPEGHKVTLIDIAEGQPIVRYGEVIGCALKALPQGSWVEESVMRMPEAPELDTLPLATKVPPKAPPLSGRTFLGYRNPDGSAGTKNLLGIHTSVQCVAGVVNHAVKKIKEELLPQYPNVDDVVALNHTYGCGVAINATDAYIPIRTIQNLAKHPNFGGEVLIVGLGCEKFTPDRLAAGNAKATILSLQNYAGYAAQLKALMVAAEERLERLNRRTRVPCPLSDLVVGVQCGGSDALSGVTANPAVGYASDLLVLSGATVLFSEVTEVRDAIHLLTPRAATVEVGQALIREMQWYDDYLKRGGADRSANTTPGNKKGGLANIVEKSLGSIAKSGTSAISGVLGPGERVKEKGLIFAATPASDFICGTLQMASGIHLQVFTTGRGTPYGLAALPVIKVGTNTTLAQQWPDLIDIDAGKVATGEASIESMGEEIFEWIIAVASGERTTWAEKWGLVNDLVLFNPAPAT